MAIHYAIIQELELVYQNWSGHVSLSEIARAIETYTADQHRLSHRRQLIDFEGAKTFDISQEDMRAILKMETSGDIQPPFQSVVIAPSDLAFGLSRQYQSLASASDIGNVQVFRNEKQALSALGRPESTVKEMLDLHRTNIVFRSVKEDA